MLPTISTLINYFPDRAIFPLVSYNKTTKWTWKQEDSPVPEIDVIHERFVDTPAPGTRYTKKTLPKITGASVRLLYTDVVIDVDTKNDADGKLVKLFAEDFPEIWKLPHVVTPSGGRHYYLQIEHPRQLSKTSERYGRAIELLSGCRNQLVACWGTQVSTGNRAYIASDRDALNDYLSYPKPRTTAPESLLAHFVARKRKPRTNSKPTDNVTTQEALEIVDNIKPEKLQDHTSYIAAQAAVATLKKQLPEDDQTAVTEKLREKCQDAAAGNHDPVEFERTADSMMSTETHAGVKTVRKLGRPAGNMSGLWYVYGQGSDICFLKHGAGKSYNRKLFDVKYSSEPILKTDDKKKPIAASGYLVQEGVLNDLQVIQRYADKDGKVTHATIDELNRKLEANGEVLAISWTTEDFVPDRYCAYQSYNDEFLCRNLYHRQPFLSDAEYKPTIAEDVLQWLDYHCRMLIGDEDCIANGASRKQWQVYYYFIVASMQNPLDKITFMPVIKSPQGCGKNTVSNLVQYVLGERHAFETSAASLKTAENDRIVQSLFVNISEGKITNEDAINRMKVMVTESTLAHKKLYKDVDQRRVRFNIQFLTNSNIPVKIDTSERRIFYVSSPHTPRSTDYSYMRQFLMDNPPPKWGSESPQPSTQYEYFTLLTTRIFTRDNARQLDRYLEETSRLAPEWFICIKDAPVTSATEELALAAESAESKTGALFATIREMIDEDDRTIIFETELLEPNNLVYNTETKRNIRQAFEANAWAMITKKEAETHDLPYRVGLGGHRNVRWFYNPYRYKQVPTRADIEAARNVLQSDPPDDYYDYGD